MNVIKHRGELHQQDAHSEELHIDDGEHDDCIKFSSSHWYTHVE